MKTRKKPWRPGLAKTGGGSKPDHISYSQIQGGRCLYRHLLVRIRKEVKDTSEAMHVGAFVHKVLEKYIGRCLEMKTDADAETMRETINESMNRMVPEARFPELYECLMTFAERGFDPETILEVEKSFHVEFSPGMWMDGRIDRVNSYEGPDGTILEIIDYKHTARVMTEAEVKEDLQLRIYRAMAVDHIWPGHNLVRVGIYHTRYNVLRWSGEPEPVLDVAKGGEAITAMLERQWKRLHDTPIEGMKPEPSPQCWEYGGCPVMLAGKCPKFSAKSIEKMAGGKDIEDRVRAARAMKAELDKTVKRLKGDMQESSPITVDGKEVGFKFSASKKWPLVPTYEWMTGHGLSLGHVRVSETDVRKACGGKKKMDGMEDIAELESLHEESPSTRFVY